jgi:hypothetical protein
MGSNDYVSHPPLAGEKLRLINFAFGQVLVESAAPHRVPDSSPAFSYWPCPGCDTRQLLDDVWMVTVSDPPGDRNRRAVMICAACAASLSRQQQSDDIST